ncbi:uncharacterized protein LOC125327988 [Corvus hawaiiensis]|uniref:uncharacterized protein LOC125327988 n=1 Tax=Corvus hawaiiensis TaxID=134902 RepID=UPI002018E2F6|nr:uncharacterized protein LOC125327988 [Corvus hawaiiensis]
MDFPNWPRTSKFSAHPGPLLDGHSPSWQASFRGQALVWDTAAGWWKRRQQQGGGRRGHGPQEGDAARQQQGHGKDRSAWTDSSSAARMWSRTRSDLQPLLALHPWLCPPAPFPSQVHAGASLLVTRTQRVKSKSGLEEQQPPRTIPRLIPREWERLPNTAQPALAPDGRASTIPLASRVLPCRRGQLAAIPSFSPWEDTPYIPHPHKSVVDHLGALAGFLQSFRLVFRLDVPQLDEKTLGGCAPSSPLPGYAFWMKDGAGHSRDTGSNPTPASSSSPSRHTQLHLRGRTSSRRAAPPWNHGIFRLEETLKPTYSMGRDTLH